MKKICNQVLQFLSWLRSPDSDASAETAEIAGALADDLEHEMRQRDMVTDSDDTQTGENN